MAPKIKKNRKRGEQRRPVSAPTDAQPDNPIETDPAVERGERIDTGKTIARGGKEEGHVPGAQPPKKATT